MSGNVILDIILKDFPCRDSVEIVGHLTALTGDFRKIGPPKFIKFELEDDLIIEFIPVERLLPFESISTLIMHQSVIYPCNLSLMVGYNKNVIACIDRIIEKIRFLIIGHLVEYKKIDEYHLTNLISLESEILDFVECELKYGLY